MNRAQENRKKINKSKIAGKKISKTKSPAIIRPITVTEDASSSKKESDKKITNLKYKDEFIPDTYNPQYVSISSYHTLDDDKKILHPKFLFESETVGMKKSDENGKYQSFEKQNDLVTVNNQYNNHISDLYKRSDQDSKKQLKKQFHDFCSSQRTKQTFSNWPVILDQESTEHPTKENIKTNCPYLKRNIQSFKKNSSKSGKSSYLDRCFPENSSSESIPSKNPSNQKFRECQDFKPPSIKDSLKNQDFERSEPERTFSNSEESETHQNVEILFEKHNSPKITPGSKRDHKQLISDARNADIDENTEHSPRRSFLSRMSVFIICFLFIICYIIDDLNKNTETAQIKKSEPVLHKFIQIREKEHLKTLLKEDWLLIIQINNEHPIVLLPFLLRRNVARLYLRDFTDILILDCILGDKLQFYIKNMQNADLSVHLLTFHIKDSTVFTTDHELVHTLDLNRKIDLINVVNLFALLTNKKIVKNITKIGAKLGMYATNIFNYS